MAPNELHRNLFTDFGRVRDSQSNHQKRENNVVRGGAVYSDWNQGLASVGHDRLRMCPCFHRLDEASVSSAGGVESDAGVRGHFRTSRTVHFCADRSRLCRSFYGGNLF
ncbi:hypothetical protein D3C81_1441390 [compost metagenome]